jgi:hypothetical protein
MFQRFTRRARTVVAAAVADTLAAFDIEPDALRTAVAATERRRTG